MCVSLMTVAERVTDTFLLQQEKVFRGAPLFPQKCAPQDTYLISPEPVSHLALYYSYSGYIGNINWAYVH